MKALFEGPNTDELQALLRSAIPPGTRVLDVSRDGNELIVNLSSELQQLTGEALIDGVAQIVLTAYRDHRSLGRVDRDRRCAAAVAGSKRRAAERAADPLRLPRAGALFAAGVSLGAVARFGCTVAVGAAHDSSNVPSRRAATIIPPADTRATPARDRHRRR